MPLAELPKRDQRGRAPDKIQIGTALFNGFSLLFGTAAGGISLAALIARNFGLELPAAPESIIGGYENIRNLTFSWVPTWWQVWLSDLSSLYLLLAFSVVRAQLLIWLLSDLEFGGRSPPNSIFGRIQLVLFGLKWPVTLFAVFGLDLKKKRVTRDSLVILGSISLTALFGAMLLVWGQL